jgi:hypothetical protein
MVKRFLLVLLMVPALAMATGTKTPTIPPAVQHNDQDQSQYQDQSQGQSQDVTVDVSSAATASLANASDQANSQTTTFTAAPSIVLVPNNNTENCLRVIGLSFANTSGGGGLGIPYRSAKCDFEQAGDDAFAQGNMRLGWFWKCHNSNLYKQFSRKGAKRGQKIEACSQAMWQMIEPKEPTPTQKTEIEVDFSGLPLNQCCTGCDHPEVHDRIFEKCQQK